MKNVFLFLGLLLTISATAYAQQAEKQVVRPGQMGTHLDSPILTKPQEPLSTGQSQRNAPMLPVGAPLIDAVTSFKVGESSNAFTFIYTENNQIVTAPGIGTGGGSGVFLYRPNIGERGGNDLYKGRNR